MSDDLRDLAEQKAGNPLSELVAFLAHTKKWWLTPIIVTLLLLAVLILTASTGAAPFIYTLF